MIEDLPGYQAAKDSGYTLYAYDGAGNSARYGKGDLALQVSKDGYAKLYAVVGMVTLAIDPFSFPNKNLHIFEREIQNILDAISLSVQVKGW